MGGTARALLSPDISSLRTPRGQKMKSLCAVAYLSSATRLIEQSEIEGLLANIRPKNAAAGITGMLIYCDGKFMQYIEGPNDKIAQLLEIIKKDTRHNDIVKLFEEPIETREFADWSMAYRTMEKQTFLDLTQADWLIDHRTDLLDPGMSLARMLCRSFWKNCTT
jgi:hypothetical protein